MLKMIVRMMRSGLVPTLKKFGELHKGLVETNTDLKAAKYQRCGLKVKDRQAFPSGVVMDSLEYR